LLLLPVGTFTLLATERRAGYIGVMVAFVAILLLMAVAHRKAFVLVGIPLLLAGAVYFPLFWRSDGMLAQPARAVRSLTQPDPRDAASNFYRDLETVNIRQTIRANPLLGVGFGRPFTFYVQLPDLSWWPFWHYEPHNNILWVWLKTGALGFAAFWFLMGSALLRAAYIARRSEQPYMRNFGILSLIAIIVTLVFSYVDLGLVSPRVPILLGTVLGCLAVLHRVQAEEQTYGMAGR
jgi:O-antigen ligase